MSGKVIKTVSVTNGDIQNKLNVADVATGMYKIIWHNGNTIQSQNSNDKIIWFCIIKEL